VRLPDDVHARALTTEDIDETVAMVNACELHDSGEIMLERADLLADSRTVGFDRSRDWIGVFADDRIVGRGLFVRRRSAWIDVHPTARGRGIGTWLRRWSEDRARAVGSDTVGQTIDDRRSEVITLLTIAGYGPKATSWILRMDHEDRPQPTEPPDGIQIRAFLPYDEDDVLAMFERSFSEWPGRQPTPLDSWRSMVTRREGFEAEDLVLAVADRRIVGGAFLIDADEIWVDKLAVDREFRHRGIARALLQTAFERSFDRGYAWTSLSTDSATGALPLYERIGMRVHRSFTQYGLDL
jgi:GNAT superfamily N-acetyltransferase